MSIRCGVTWAHTALGEMSAGGGLTCLNSMLALMEAPGMNKWLYSHTEGFRGLEMQHRLACSMQQVVKEEKQYVIVTSSFHHGLPSITVVINGG